MKTPQPQSEGKVSDLDGCLSTEVLYTLHVIDDDLDRFVLPVLKLPEVGQKQKTL